MSGLVNRIRVPVFHVKMVVHVSKVVIVTAVIVLWAMKEKTAKKRCVSCWLSKKELWILVLFFEF